MRWLWALVHGWSLDKKRAFLTFVTGSDRAPVGGLGKLPFVVQRAGPDTGACDAVAGGCCVATVCCC